MSLKMMVQAMELQVGSSLTKLVLIKLSDNANDNGQCWPSYDTIARVCEMSRRSAINHINKLIEKGLLKKDVRRGEKGNKSNLYYLCLDNKKTINPSEFPAPPLVNNIHHPSESPTLDSESPAPPPSESPAPESVSLLESVSEPVIESNKKACEPKQIERYFEIFWSHYPNKSDKKKAKAKFIKLHLTDFAFIRIMEGLKKQIVWRQDAPPTAFVPQWRLPTTWLNGENWNDELKPWPRNITNGQKACSDKTQRTIEMLDELELT